MGNQGAGHFCLAKEELANQVLVLIPSSGNLGVLKLFVFIRTPVGPDKSDSNQSN
jgi:hypothetical protein